MEKKVLKFYEAPVLESLDVEEESVLAASPGENPEDVKDEETIDWNL